MDPNACLERILNLWESATYDETSFACQDLQEWLGKGGAMPTIDREQLSMLLRGTQSFCTLQAEGII